MPIAFQCPKCRAPYKVKDELAGKKAACKKCQHVMTVPRPEPSAKIEDSHAIEALATAALGDDTSSTDAAPVDAAIKLECEFCFEPVEFPAEKAGKKAPCPSCRRIVTVPVPQTGKPKKDWRAADHNLTMALKNAEAAPVDAWGNQQKAIVSREALVEAAVVEDRSKAGLRDWTNVVISVGVIAVVLAAGGLWWMRGKARDDRRIGLMEDAIAAIGPKGVGGLPQGWSAVVHAAAGEFYIGEGDIKKATRHLQHARTAARAVDSPSDRAVLLRSIASLQAKLIGDATKIAAGQALEWEDAHRELRQTLQGFKDLPREEGLLALEQLGRAIGGLGPDKPILMTVAGDAMPRESDRADALAAIALSNPAIADAFIEEAKRVYPLTGEGAPAPRYAALLLSKGQAPAASKLVPEAGAGEPPLPTRLAFAEGWARTGQDDDLAKARKIASADGKIEDRVAAWCVLADARGQATELESAVNFTVEQAQKFTLPNWPILRLADACQRAGRKDLVRQLADGVKQSSLKPWLELSALGSQGALDSGTVEKMADKSLAQAFAWGALARATAKDAGDPQSAIKEWSVASARPLGYAGAALGLQDQGK